MSENDNCKCCGKVSWQGTPDEESLEVTSKNRHRGCGHYLLGRVRTILALGYWVLGKYWVVLLLADFVFHCDTQCNTDQTAVSTVHMITIFTSLVWLLSADDVRESGEG